MNNPQIIDHPEKIGVGTYPSVSLDRMSGDLETLNTSWFYSWMPSLPASSFPGWTLGPAASNGGGAGDHELKLGRGGDAWAMQDTSAAAGARYSLQFDAAGIGAGQGGVTLKFLDAGGKVLKTDYVGISGGERKYAITGAAPAGALTGEILAYSGGGDGIRIDNISFLSGGKERVVNGNFENYFGVPSSVAADFVPMIWSARDMPALADRAKLAGSNTLLGFNEPDHKHQANMSVAQALDLWPQLMATGKRLGSPAPTTPQTLGQGKWLDSFMKGAAQRGYKVDFVAVHYYSANPSVEAFKSFLEKVHAAYGKPVWVTEWALVDWNNLGRFSFAETAKFLTEATQMMDDLDFVERHAWFGTYDGLDALTMQTNLFDNGGRLTQPGQAFRDLTNGASDSTTHDININGTEKGEVLTGTSGADTIYGKGGNDRLDGGAGADTMNGGVGDDAYVVDNVGDKVIEAAGEGSDWVEAFITYTLPANAEHLILKGTSALNGTGNELANSLWGNGAANTLNGGAGDDVLVGLGGADILIGGGGKDIFRYYIASESQGSGVDHIRDFVRGTDKIDLSALDASSKLAGDQAFKFIGEGAFTGAAGEVQYKKVDLAGTTSDHILVQADTNGDRVADFAIILDGGLSPIQASDFLL